MQPSELLKHFRVRPFQCSTLLGNLTSILATNDTGPLREFISESILCQTSNLAIHVPICLSMSLYIPEYSHMSPCIPLHPDILYTLNDNPQTIDPGGFKTSKSGGQRHRRRLGLQGSMPRYGLQHRPWASWVAAGDVYAFDFRVGVT